MATQADIEDFKFVCFKKFFEDHRKITRKKHLLNVETKEIYLPEGHSAFLIIEKEDGVGEDSIIERTVTLFFNGGARYSEESTWDFAKSIYIYNFKYTATDIWVERVECHDQSKILGSKLPALTKSAGASFSTSDDFVIVFWGGLDVNQYKPTNDLYLTETATHRRQVKYKATTYAASRQGLEDSRFAKLLIQEGNVPCVRLAVQFLDLTTRLLFVWWYYFPKH